MGVVGWSIILGVSVIAFIVLAVIVLPSVFLKTDYLITAPRDRGIRHIKEPNGTTLLYEPNLKARRYVKQYVLSDRGGKKVIVCKLADSVDYIDYDVALFNNLNEVFEVVNVKEQIETRGYTKEMELPEETSYATVIVNGVNGEDFSERIVGRVKGKKIALYAVFAGLLAVAEVACVKLCCAYAFGGIFAESFMVSSKGMLVTAIAAAAVVLINTLGAVIALCARGGKKKGRESKVR